MIETPYLLFLGDAPDQLAAKVAQGIKDWRPDNAVGQFRHAGLQGRSGAADMTLEAAREAGAKTLVIGVANRGGVISPGVEEGAGDGAGDGVDLASGLAQPAARRARSGGGGRGLRAQTCTTCGCRQCDYPIANGVKRTGKRCLAVGTDCSVGKMYTALAHGRRRCGARGMKATFRATGQTGILITGDGRAAGCGGGRFHGRVDRSG